MAHARWRRWGGGGGENELVCYWGSWRGESGVPGRGEMLSGARSSPCARRQSEEARGETEARSGWGAPSPLPEGRGFCTPSPWGSEGGS